jgi:hypothetical protein
MAENWNDKFAYLTASHSFYHNSDYLFPPLDTRARRQRR